MTLAGHAEEVIRRGAALVLWPIIALAWVLHDLGQGGGRSKRAASLTLLLLLFAPGRALAQEDGGEAEERESLIVAAGWCTFQSGEASDEEGAAPGCDLGVGVSLYGRDRWRVVAAVGSWSVGAGLAWVALRPGRGPVIAVAVGLMAPYDSSGIDPHPRLALGATFGF